jgi:TPR repeat protein
MLGFMYSKGHGVEQDNKESIKWYRKAAGNGDDNAKKALAILGE